MNERKFINEAVKKLLVSEYIRKETENAGFGGMEMKRTPFGTNITLHVNKPGLVIGRHGSKVQQITENLEKKYQIESPQIEVKEIDNPDLNPQVVSKKIALSLEKGWAYRKAGNTSLRRIVENGARGVIISVSGKLSGERGRMQKFMSGSVKYSGEPAREGMERGFSIAKLKLGVIGVKVGILKSDYKLPDDYVVSEKLGVSTPQLIQEGDQKAEAVAKKPEGQRERPGARGRRPRKPEERQARPAERKAKPTPEAEKAKEKVSPQAEAKKVEAKPEVKEPEAEVKAEEVKPQAEEKKVEAKPEVKEPEAKAEGTKPVEEKPAEEPKEAVKEKPAPRKTTKKTEKKSEKKAEKKESEEPKPEAAEEVKKDEGRVEENGAKSETTETDGQ